MRERAPTLLVIEDAADQALLVGIAAERALPGLDVRTADNGAQGIAYLSGAAPFENRAAHPLPNLVILDLYMPELDGFEVLAWIREHMPDVPFPIVVLTASVVPEDEARALALGARSVHKKPGDLRSLGEVVGAIVSSHIGRGDIIGAHIWELG